MKVYPKSKFDKEQSRKACYEYLSNKEAVDWKDNYSKLVFKQKPWHMIEKDRQQADSEVIKC